MPAPSDVERMLRAAQLRVTRPRAAVLAAVHEHPHAATDAIWVAARRDLGSVSHQGVYDVLRTLTDAGLVRRIQPSGSVARYEARVGDNHHHAVCRSCGVIVDVDCAVGATPCLTASHSAGYDIDEAEVVYWGSCPACATGRDTRIGTRVDTRGDTHRHAPAATEPATGPAAGPGSESDPEPDTDSDKGRGTR